jgi:multidrug efflux pump subunit AcrA (membrane-fusion protein)
MKHIFLILLFNSFLFSSVYYAKVEPYEFRDISSNVSGLVLYIDEDSLGKKLSKNPYIKIDSKLDEQELKYIKRKLSYLNNIVDSNKEIIKNLELLLSKKRDNYKKIKSLKIKSSIEKNKEFYDLITSENQFLSTIKELNNLKVQIADLKLREATLNRSIKDKNLVADGYVLYSILVKVGQVVGVSTPLAKVADISKAKLTIYLDESDMLNIDKKVVYIDGKKQNYKITRVSKIADSKNISKYKANIIIDSPKIFSKLLKIELR